MVGVKERAIGIIGELMLLDCVADAISIFLDLLQPAVDVDPGLVLVVLPEAVFAVG